MLKNLKSKFLLGVMVIAIMFVGAFALTQKASAAPQAIVTVADIQYAATVKLGSSGQASLIWQNFLNGYSITANLVADGKFGPLSEVQAKAWQASRGLSADGVLGAMSRASAIAQITSGIPASTFPAGCTSTVGYSSVTGLPCAGVSYPAGCSAGTAFSSTTGLSCTAVVTNLPAGCSSTAGFSSTTGAKCDGGSVSTNTGPLAGGAGSIDVVQTSTDVQDVAIEGQATKMLGFKVEASDSDVSVTNLKVTLENIDASVAAPNNSPYRLSNYVDSVDIYMGSTKVGSANVSDFTKSGYQYTKSIALSNAVVRMGASHKATFYVVLNAAASIDTANMVGGAQPARLNIDVGNIRYQDATGVIMTDGNFDLVEVVPPSTGSFDSLTNAGDVKLTISKGSGSPIEETVQISSTGSTSDLLMNQFKLKATGSDLSFDQITFAINSVTTPTGPFADMVQGLELRNGTDVLASDPTFYAADGTTVATTDATVKFAKFLLDNTYTIPQDSTDTFGVYAKIADIDTFTAGSLQVSLATTGIATEDTNGDVVTNESGSATGEAQTFMVNGANIVYVSSTSSAANDTNTSRDFTLVFDVTAIGEDLTVLRTNVDSSNTDGVQYIVSGTTGVVDVNSPSLTSTASLSTDTYTVSAGETKRFTLTVNVGTSTTGMERLVLQKVGGVSTTTAVETSSATVIQ